MTPTTTPALSDPRNELILSLLQQIARLQLQVVSLGSGTLPSDTV